jgi:hypothetical protein
MQLDAEVPAKGIYIVCSDVRIYVCILAKNDASLMA